jgi:hypothetical protein
VGFEWDESSKVGANFRKHGVRIPEAIPVFDDPYAITITDNESRRKSSGLSHSGWARPAGFLSLSTHGAAKTSESFLPARLKRTNVQNTRHNHERSVRFQ